jgi:uncharacterized protein (DUF2235 family)
VLREYAKVFGGRLAVGRRDHAPVHFVGLWDTVKAAGNLRRQLRWPFTRQLPHAAYVRHAVALDEWRHKYAEYLVTLTVRHLIPEAQDLREVWFAGVHSDVGGMFPTGAHLSDIPLKWMIDEATTYGLLVSKRRYLQVCDVSLDDAIGEAHQMSRWWRLLGSHHRKAPDGALVHASVRERIAADPDYRSRLPPRVQYVDEDWMTPKL